MLKLCRLCAKCTEPTDLTTNISDVESKLTICCGWKPLEYEIQMPNKACKLCVDKLQMCWDFVESVWAAEKQLNKLLSEVRANTEVETKSGEIIDSVKCELEEVKYSSDEHEADDNGFDDESIFGEPIDYSNDDDSCHTNDQPMESPKKLRKRKRAKNDPFPSELAPEDCLKGGLISTSGIMKLEKLYPEMKSMTWNDVEYKCDKCNRTFKGINQFYTHIRSIHIEEVVSIKVPCVYCNTKYRREFALNRHIATEHFQHLKYR